MGHGGLPLLWQHLFWFFDTRGVHRHPARHAWLAAAVHFSRKPIFG
jgi:heme/copper-type cytochrome/quinol oxidase subunit 1